MTKYLLACSGACARVNSRIRATSFSSPQPPFLLVTWSEANSTPYDYVTRCLERTLSVYTGIKFRNSSFYRVELLNVKRSYCVVPSLKEMDGLDIIYMRVEPCVESQFIKTSRVVFKQVSSKSSLESRIEGQFVNDILSLKTSGSGDENGATWFNNTPNRNPIQCTQPR